MDSPVPHPRFPHTPRLPPPLLPFHIYVPSSYHRFTRLFGYHTTLIWFFIPTARFPPTLLLIRLLHSTTTTVGLFLRLVRSGYLRLHHYVLRSRTFYHTHTPSTVYGSRLVDSHGYPTVWTVVLVTHTLPLYPVIYHLLPRTVGLVPRLGCLFCYHHTRDVVFLHTHLRLRLRSSPRLAVGYDGYTHTPPHTHTTPPPPHTYVCSRLVYFTLLPQLRSLVICTRYFVHLLPRTLIPTRSGFGLLPLPTQRLRTFLRLRFVI